MTNTTEPAPHSAAASTAHGLSPDQLAEAKRYNRQAFCCDLLDRAIDVLYLAGITWLGAVPLDRWLQSFDFGQRPSIRLVALFLLVTVIHIAVSLPLSFYSGHILEHRYQLSRQSAARWFQRYAKRHALTLLIGSLTTLGLYWIIWTTGSWWWLVAAGGYFLLSVVIGQLAPVLILPLFYRIERISDESLGARLSALSAGTGLSIEGVYRMSMSDETAKANAMLAGLGATRRVILGDTLLDNFSPEEIDVIFAHEVGHHVHRHVPQLIVSGLLYGVVGFWICDRLLNVWVERIDGQVDYGQFPVHTLPLLMLVTTLFFMLVEPLQNVISRHFERQADRYALQRTGRYDAYRSAFTKLARLNKADPDPHPWELFLFHSHPSISQRLAAAEARGTRSDTRS
jgi:STE24 endopeptidase